MLKNVTDFMEEQDDLWRLNNNIHVKLDCDAKRTSQIDPEVMPKLELNMCLFILV